MKILISFLLTIMMLWGHAQDKKLCITIDDLSAVVYGIPGNDFQWEINRSLVSALADHGAIGIGYVNEGKLYHQGKVDTARVNMLRHWLKNGQELGNHTFSHQNYHRVTFKAYTRDILQGERILRPLMEEYGLELKYFRHPYLRSGMRHGHADSLLQFLQKHNYTEAPVTIDNEEYLFALAYSRAYRKQDNALMEKIGKDYVGYMEDKLLYFEAQAIKLFNRPIHQILLIHANLLNAHYLDDLMKVYKGHGYTFVSQGEALEDPAYQEKVTRFGDWGISWLDRWALSQGKKGDFFQADPKTPDYIREMTQ